MSTERTTDKSYLNDPYVKEFPETVAFWEAAERAVLVLPTCLDCRKPHWHPRGICPLCASDRIEWKTASGNGRLYSYSVGRKQQGQPIVAYVRLDEGPLMMTNIVDTDASKLKLEQRVRVMFRRDEDGRNVPVFSAAVDDD